MKKILTSATMFFALTAYAQFNLDSGLVSYLSFDETISDNSANGYSVQEHGTVSIEKKYGNSYLKFSEASGVEVEVPDTSVYAVSFYVKSNNRIDELTKALIPVSFVETGTENSQVGSYAMLGDFSNKGIGEQVSLVKNDSPKGVYDRIFVTEGDFDDKWHHIVYNYESTKYEIYIDGVKQNVTKGSATNFVGLIEMIKPVIGTKKYPNGALSKSAGGSIDEVRFYNRAITTEEVDYLSSEKDWDLSDDLIFHLGFEGDYTDGSTNNYSTETVGETEIVSLDINSYLSFTESSGVKLNIPDTNVYALSFYVKGNERVDALSKYFVPVALKETGTFSSQNGVYTMLGDFTNKASGEVVSLIGNSNKFDRTMLIGEDIDDKWHHVVYNYNGSSYDIYIDGVKKITSIGSSSGHVSLVEMNNPVVGTRVFSNGDNPNTTGGSMDEVKAFSRSLTDNEINWLANEIDWEAIIATVRTSEISTNLLYPTIVENVTKFYSSEKVYKVVFFNVAGEEVVSFTDLEMSSSELLPKGLNYAKVYYQSGEVYTQKIIKL